ncbi:antitoxin VbhA family protein [Herminiimonas sp. CN]|nr:antitoxin VbhA family protein [Herminiimonas sp. CN]
MKNRIKKTNEYGPGTFRISNEERENRLAAVNTARASVRLEGFIVSPED